MGRMFKAQFDKRPLRDEQWPCDDIREGDGIDPRLESHPKRNIVNRKALQLCAQVVDALNLGISECRDDRLQNVYIESAIPDPDSTQLLITAVVSQEALEGLQAAYGKLRTDIAEAICRKKVPNLKFRVVADNIKDDGHWTNTDL
jgi:ribosome-binding factor A